MEQYPPAIQHEIDNERDAKSCYLRVMRKKHKKLLSEEPGLLLNEQHAWLGASPDGIRKCDCCSDTLVEIKCPYKGYNMDTKESFLLDTVGGFISDKGGIYVFKKITYIILKSRSQWLYAMSLNVILVCL